MATLLRPPLVFDRRQKRPIGTPDSYPNLITSTLNVDVLTLKQPAFSIRLSDSAPPRIKQVRFEDFPNLACSTLYATNLKGLPLGPEQWDDSAPPRKTQVFVELLSRPLTLGINPNAAVLQLDASATPRKAQVYLDLYPSLGQNTLATTGATLDPPLLFSRLSESAPSRRLVNQVEQLGRQVWVDPLPNVLTLSTSAFQAKYQVIAQQLDYRALWRDDVPQIQRLDASAWMGKEPVYVDPPALLTLRMSLIAVPNVVGELQAQAETDLINAGFVSQASTAYSDTIAIGLVISQDPLGGALSSAGTTIAIVISLGPQPFQAPIDQPSGGFFYDVDSYRAANRRRKKQLEELEREREEAELPPVDLEIAQLLHRQEQLDEERSERDRIQAIADRYSSHGRELGLPNRVRAALIKAFEERSKNALEQLDREINRLMEEEALTVLQLLLNDE